MAYPAIKAMQRIRFSVDEGSEISSVYGVPVRSTAGIPDHQMRYFVARAGRTTAGKWCWLWSGSSRGGPMNYGYVQFGSVKEPAHRFSYRAFVGEIPDGYHVHHKCSNPLCVNPAHLEAVAPRDHVLNHTPKAVSAKNAAKTHCDRGHELGGYNLIVSPSDGRRHCRICKNEWTKQMRAATKTPRPPRTHCKYGHELTPDNLTPKNACRECGLLRSKAFRQSNPEWRTAAIPWSQKQPKTHCKHGHPWVPENLYEHGGQKFCRTCRSETMARLKSRNQ